MSLTVSYFRESHSASMHANVAIKDGMRSEDEEKDDSDYDERNLQDLTIFAKHKMDEFAMDVPQENDSECNGDDDDDEDRQEEKAEVEEDWDDDAESEEDSEAVAFIEDQNEYEAALHSVRRLGGSHQEAMVNTICDVYAELNGEEPTTAQLYGIFGKIKQQFAEEAEEEEEDGDESEDGVYGWKLHRGGAACDIYQALNDEEPSMPERYPLFGGTKEDLLDDAAEDEVFEQQFCSAIHHIQTLAKMDQEQMLLSVIHQFETDNGSEATEGMIEDALKTFAIPQHSVISEEEAVEEEEVDARVEPQLLVEAMDSAMTHIRNLGKRHQEELVNTVCDIYCDFNGQEPSIQEISGIFEKIRRSFDDETKEQFLEFYENDDDDEADSDFDPNDDSFDYLQDSLDDISNDSEHADDAEDEDYVLEHDAFDYEQNDEAASERESEDKEDADDSEAEYNPETDAFDYCVDIEDDRVEQPELEESEESEDGGQEEEDEDADYNPEYDTFDYSHDVESAEEDESDDSNPNNDTFYYSRCNDHDIIRLIQEDDEEDDDYSAEQSAFDDSEEDHVHDSNAEEAKANEDDDLNEDSDYNPDSDTFDYCMDIEDELSIYESDEELVE